MFANATRKKFRYPYKGQITTEDLWDLSIEELNKVYIELNNRAMEYVTAVDLPTITKPSAEQDELIQKMNVVREVANIKVREIRIREEQLCRESEKAKIESILRAKREAELMNMSTEELEAMLNNL